MTDIALYFNEPLRDLGTVDDRYRGILIPEAEIGVAHAGISKVFLDDAENYHNQYSNTPHWLSLFAKAFTEVPKPTTPEMRILDIGSGSGANSVIPCLEMFPECRIVATDLSPQLLRILQGYLHQNCLTERVACVCTNVMQTKLKPGAFDLVIGGSILHHLVQPELALASARKALVPGGLAIFFEPFDGHTVLRVAYELILARGETLAPEIEAHLRAMILEWTVRAGQDKSDPVFQYVDDKWLFNRGDFEGFRRTVGFSDLTIVPLHPDQQLFHRTAKTLLKLGANREEDALPDWAWNIVDTFDRVFSDAMKRDLPLECAVVFHN